jgi:circadian clock protein KaiB
MTATAEPSYELTLFVGGASDHSTRAIQNIKHICEIHLEGRYQLSVVDVYEERTAALNSRLVVVPTLVKFRPTPVRRLVGDLADAAKVLLMLELPVAREAPRMVS